MLQTQEMFHNNGASKNYSNYNNGSLHMGSTRMHNHNGNINQNKNNKNNNK